MLISHKSTSKDQLLHYRDSGQQVREIELFNWNQTIKNNIILITIFNLICIVVNTFSIAFYKWYEIEYDTVKNRKSIWLNLLYIYDQETKSYYSFKEYSQLDQNICEMDKSKCQNDLVILSWVGLICFIVIFLSLLLQVVNIYRLWRILIYIEDRKEIKTQLKGSLIYGLVCTGQIGALLSYFIIITFYFDGDRFSVGQFNLSYWISVGCSVSLILISFYYKWSKNLYHQFLQTQKLENHDSEMHKDS